MTTISSLASGSSPSHICTRVDKLYVRPPSGPQSFFLIIGWTAVYNPGLTATSQNTPALELLASGLIPLPLSTSKLRHLSAQQKKLPCTSLESNRRFLAAVVSSRPSLWGIIATTASTYTATSMTKSNQTVCNTPKWDIRTHIYYILCLRVQSTYASIGGMTFIA